MKENFACPASSRLFGHLVKEIWGDGVRVVKRGSRKGRQNYYSGLQRKSSISLHDAIDENQPISLLKTGWHLVSDQGGQYSFARYEPWSFRNQRVVTEVKFAIKVESYSIILTSHGCQADLTTVFQLECLEQSPNWKRIESVLASIDNSTLCRECQSQMERFYIRCSLMKLAFFLNCRQIEHQKLSNAGLFRRTVLYFQGQGSAVPTANTYTIWKKKGRKGN